MLPADERSAIFAHWGDKDPLGPILLTHDLVVLDPWIDKGVDAPMLLGALHAQGRTVYFLQGIPPSTTRERLAGLKLDALSRPPVRLLRAALPPQPD